MKKNIIIIFVLIFNVLLSIIPNVNAEESNIYVDPSNLEIDPGESFTINISSIMTEKIEGYEFDIIFDPAFLIANSVVEGDIFQDFTTWFNSGTIDNSKGYINDVFSIIMNEGNTSKSGTLAIISFTSLTKNGTTNIMLNDTGLSNDNSYIPISLQNGQINIGNTSINNENPEEVNQEDNSTIQSNVKPNLPEKPKGNQICQTNVSYYFSSKTTDSDNDDLFYTFDWGDGFLTENLGPFRSGEICNASHEWIKPGIYNITVQALDVQGKQSDLSPKLTIFVKSQEENNSNQLEEKSGNEKQTPMVSVGLVLFIITLSLILIFVKTKKIKF